MKGLRNRARNTAAGQVAEDLGVLRAASGDELPGDLGTEVVAALAEGEALLADLHSALHGDAAAPDVDGGAARAWRGRARSLRSQLADAVDGPAWMPDHQGADLLVRTGTRAIGVVADVRRAGWGNERVADLDVSVTVRDGDGELRTMTRSVSVPVTHAPRAGDAVEVAYDPTSGAFVYRPHVALPGA